MTTPSKVRRMKTRSVGLFLHCGNQPCSALPRNWALCQDPRRCSLCGAYHGDIHSFIHGLRGYIGPVGKAVGGGEAHAFGLAFKGTDSHSAVGSTDTLREHDTLRTIALNVW